MADDLLRELLTMKDEIADAMRTRGEEFRAASQAHASSFAQRAKESVGDLADLLKEEELRLEELVASRPIPALAAAFVLGLVVGISARSSR